MAAKDYYAILGLSKNATDKDIKQAYRKLARQYHPDVNPGNKSAEARFKEINEAHEVLSDPEKRKKYDQFGEQWQYADQFARAGGQQQQPAWEFSRGALNPTSATWAELKGLEISSIPSCAAPEAGQRAAP